jgi:hypothetical protein
VWGRALSIDDLLTLKPRGHFRVERQGGQIFVVVNRPGEPTLAFPATSPGHANQMRLQLSAEGLAGYIEGSA